MLRAALILILLPTVVFSQTKLHPIARSDIRVSGDLSHRIILNYARLTDSYYTPDHLATISPGWPGDAIGREILALTLLAQSTGNESPGLDLLIENVSAHLNDNGYVGPVLTGAVQNEQYLSGHSWLLRGLCEHFAWKHDDRSLSLIRRITGGLLFRSRNQYRHYPIRAEDRSKKGEVAGNITRTVDGWELSTDVGCAFIMLDGATAAQQVIPSRELESLIKEMIARFEQVDLVKVAAQTHATLAALRGILRFYETHPDPKYLEFVTRTYALYFSTATTEHYANYNWFTRPEWTEACAVVDSYMLAMQLYAITRDAHYLEDGAADLLQRTLPRSASQRGIRMRCMRWRDFQCTDPQAPRNLRSAVLLLDARRGGADRRFYILLSQWRGQRDHASRLPRQRRDATSCGRRHSPDRIDELSNWRRCSSDGRRFNSNETCHDAILHSVLDAVGVGETHSE